MTPIALALARAQRRLLARLDDLEARLDARDEGAWPSYCEATTALAALASQPAPGSNGQLLTTRELAEKMQCSTRTIRRRAKAGKIAAPALPFGRAGRWRGDEGAR